MKNQNGVGERKNDIVFKLFLNLLLCNITRSVIKMRIKFKLPKDKKRHRYCLNCFSEKVADILIKKKKFYICGSCHQIHNRLIDIDPTLKWWVDKKTGEYHHESVGAIIIGPEKKILFLKEQFTHMVILSLQDIWKIMRIQKQQL